MEPIQQSLIFTITTICQTQGDFSASLRVLTVLTTICGVGIVGLYKYCSVAMQRDADAGYVYMHTCLLISLF